MMAEIKALFDPYGPKVASPLTMALACVVTIVFLSVGFAFTAVLLGAR